MLIVWNTLLIPGNQQELVSIDAGVHYWPRSWTPVEIYNQAIPNEWYISFSHSKFGIIWVMKHPENCCIIYKN